VSTARPAYRDHGHEYLPLVLHELLEEAGHMSSLLDAQERAVIARLGRVIAARRARHGLTQLQLARKIAASQRAVSLWEHGERVPNVLHMHRLAAVFGMTIDQFFGEEP
jgi:DNA-binding XRE family transcriptional regulator